MDVATMISDLGDHGFTDTETDTKVRMLQDAIWEIEGLRPWGFLEASINLTFDGSSPLATNFPANYRTALKVKNVTSGVDLEPISLQDLEESVGTQLDLVSTPGVYYHEAEKLKVWPVPSASTVLRLRYIRWSPAITSSSAETAILIPVRHHRAIVMGALMRLYDMEDDTELGARYESYFEKRIARMVEDVAIKQLDRPDFIRVLDPDMWDYDS